MPIPDEIIFDWNTQQPSPELGDFTLYDETLRDGIQSPSVFDPTIAKKIEILNLMDDLKIHYADIGLPGAGKRAYDDTLALAREISGNNLSIKAACAARTHPNDIRPIIEIAEKSGVPIEITAFLGSSPIRQYAESWDLERMLEMSGTAMDMGVQAGLPVSFVTEDTIRSRPETLERLFRNAIEHGAQRLILCDTCGHATPDGVRNLIAFTRDLIAAMGVDVEIDWHGHNDRGLALPNTLTALDAGATRIHGTALGVGERVGNASMDQLLVNLKLMGRIDWDLSKLLAYCTLVSDCYKTPIPFNYPLAGRDAFRTATGVHAAAIIKAEKKGDDWLADRIYSGVPAGLFGKRQEIEIGHMSGVSNVLYWLMSRNIDPDEALVRHIFESAKAGNHTFSEEEVMKLVSSHTDT